MTYNTVDPVPLTFMRVRGGAPVTGLAVTVLVYNAATGAPLLNSTALTEVTAGVYAYTWPHTVKVFTECVALYTVSGRTYIKPFTIDEGLDTTESLTGRAN